MEPRGNELVLISPVHIVATGSQASYLGAFRFERSCSFFQVSLDLADEETCPHLAGHINQGILRGAFHECGQASALVSMFHGIWAGKEGKGIGISCIEG